MLKYIGYSIVLTSFFLFSGLMLKAQNESNVVVDTLTAIIYFEKGKVDVEELLPSEKLKLDEILSKVSLDSGKVVLDIVLTGSASLEDEKHENTSTARARAINIRKFIQNSYPNANYMLRSKALRNQFYNTVLHSKIENKRDVLHIIKPAKTEQEIFKCLKRLRDLENGKVWKSMENNIFHSLRGVSVVILCREATPADKITSIKAERTEKTQKIAAEQAEKERIEKENALSRRKAAKLAREQKKARMKERKAAYEAQIEEVKKQKALEEQKADDEKLEQERLEQEAQKAKEARLAEKRKIEQEQKAKRDEEKRLKEEQKRLDIQEVETEDKENDDEMAYYNAGKVYRRYKSYIAGHSKKGEPFSMGVKTNLLYDAWLIPNLGFEFHLGNNWTLGADAMIAFWGNNKSSVLFKVLDADLYLRKYVGMRSRLKKCTGHHIGLVGGMLSYDFRIQNEGMYNAPFAYYGGFEYGYTVPLAKRLNIDFSLAFGYANTKHYVYDRVDYNKSVKTANIFHLISPVKAEITLIWLIGRKNFNILED